MEEMANKENYQIWHKSVVLANFFSAFQKLFIKEDVRGEDVLAILRTTYHFDLTNLHQNLNCTVKLANSFSVNLSFRNYTQLEQLP